MNDERIATLSKNLATILLEDYPGADDEVTSLTEAIVLAVTDWFEDNPEPIEGLDADPE